METFRVRGFIGVGGSGLFADSFECELEGDGVDLCAILLDVELPDGTSESRRYVPGRTAKRVSVPRESHGTLGHYECGACGTVVDPRDRYCRECGAELEDAPRPTRNERGESHDGL